MQLSCNSIRNDHVILHARVAGLLKVMNRWKLELEMEYEEKKRLAYMIRRIQEILEQDKEHLGDKEMQVRSFENMPPNPNCEFFDIDQNRIKCAIGCSMYQCGERCGYATNKPGSMPPYKTKYMSGRLEGRRGF